MMKRLLLLAALAATAPLAAWSESNSATGASGLTASARLDFGISIPKVLFLQVGTGTSYTDNAEVDNINFTVPANSVGNGTALVGTGGDLFSMSVVTVRLLGNSGDISLNSTTTGPLDSGIAGNPTVPWSDILVTPGALPSATSRFTNGAIAHPAFNTGASGGPGAPTLWPRQAAWCAGKASGSTPTPTRKRCRAAPTAARSPTTASWFTAPPCLMRRARDAFRANPFNDMRLMSKVLQQLFNGSIRYRFTEN